MRRPHVVRPPLSGHGLRGGPQPNRPPAHPRRERLEMDPAGQYR